MVASAAALEAIEHDWRVARERLVRRDDYTETPRPSGYRALHLVVKYDGLLVEMQLRTRAQHEWAYAVEVLGGRIGHDLKSGVGPKPVLDYLRAVSLAMAKDERGEPVGDDLRAELEMLRLAAGSYMGRQK